MTDTAGTLTAVPNTPPDDIDQLEVQVRQRVAALDQQIAEAKEQKKAIAVRIVELGVLRERAARMLPRAPRKRRTPAGA